MSVLSREFAVEVVLTYEEDGELPKGRQVQALVEGALIRGSVSEERIRHAIGPFSLELKRRTRRQWNPSSDDPVRSEETEIHVDHVEGTTLTSVVSGGAGIELGIHTGR